MPYWVGLGAVGVTLLLIWFVAGTWNPLKLAEGADGKTSTSKLQFLLWTGVIAFSYVALFAERVRLDEISPIDEIPENVLIALGISVVTVSGAKGITANYVNTGRLIKPNGGGGGAAKDDDGYADLSKIQMLLWTFIALFAYLLAVIHEIEVARLPEMPDIDPALMVLMGLAQGAYLGKKLVTTTTPRITGLSPAEVVAGETKVTLSGTAIGNTAAGTEVTMDGNVIPAGSSTSDADADITFTVPKVQPTKGAWPAEGLLVQIGVQTNGNASANTKGLTVKPPPPGV